MKTPLTFDPDLEHIGDADGKVVCHFGPSEFGWSNDAVHAAEIVAACNAHARLVKACEKAREELHRVISVTADVYGYDPNNDPTIKHLDAALALAKGGTP